MRSALPRRINIAIVTLRYTRNKQPTTLSETGATAAATPQDDRPRRLPRCSARRRRARGPSPPARGKAPVALRLPLPPPPRRRRRRGGLRRRERRRGSDLARAGAVAAAGGATQPPPAAGEWVLRPALPSLLPQARADPPWEHSLRRLRGDESGMGRGQLRHPVLPAVLRPPPGSGGKCELPFAPCGGFLVVPPFLSVCCAGTQPSPIAQMRLLQRLTPPPPPFSFSAFLASSELGGPLDCHGQLVPHAGPVHAGGRERSAVRVLRPPLAQSRVRPRRDRQRVGAATGGTSRGPIGELRVGRRGRCEAVQDQGGALLQAEPGQARGPGGVRGGVQGQGGVEEEDEQPPVQPSPESHQARTRLKPHPTPHREGAGTGLGRDEAPETNPLIECHRVKGKTNTEP